jgi:acyl-homoserine-lactone acylase
MANHTNSSNNTLFADAEGNAAYFHSNFVPVRNPRFDYSRPVDGSDPATDWQGVHTIDESPNAINPGSGWAYCTNNWPYSSAGPDSPRREEYPPYMDIGTENFRGVHAIMLLEDTRDFSLESLRAAAYDSYLTGFVDLVPAILRAYDALPDSNLLKTRLAGQVEALRGWDLRWAVESVPTSLAVFAGTELLTIIREDASNAGVSVYDYMISGATPSQLLEAMAAASDHLEDAVNYQHAYQLIREEMRRKKSNLLENIAKRILDALFREMDGIQKATIRIRKMHPPMGGSIRSVGVSMSRSHE